MINRRELVASGFAVAVFGTAGAAGTAAVTGTAGAVRGAAQRAPAGGATRFVADERSAHARAAGRAAALSGAVVLSTGSDVTSLYGALDATWRAAPVATGGMTTASALFVIERLAFDRGLRIEYRALHRGAGQHAAAERLGPAALLRRIGAAPGRDFAAHVGRVLVEWPKTTAARDERRTAFRALAPPSAADDGALLASWLFVPKHA